VDFYSTQIKETKNETNTNPTAFIVHDSIAGSNQAGLVVLSHCCKTKFSISFLTVDFFINTKYKKALFL